MKDYVYLQKINREIKEKDIQFFAWILTAVLLVVLFLAVCQIHAPIVDGHM
jgi:hypothetical protein